MVARKHPIENQFKFSATQIKNRSAIIKKKATILKNGRRPCFLAGPLLIGNTKRDKLNTRKKWRKRGRRRKRRRRRRPPGRLSGDRRG